MKNYVQIPTIALSQSRGELHFISTLAVKNCFSHKRVIHDRFGVKINTPKNCYVSSQYLMAKTLGWTRKRVRYTQSKLEKKKLIHVKAIYYKKRKIGTMYCMNLKQVAEPIFEEGPILLSKKYMPKNYFKLVKNNQIKHKKRYNNGMQDINDIINNLNPNDVLGPIIKKENIYTPSSPNTYNKDKENSEKEIIKKHCQRKSNEFLDFCTFQKKHPLDLRMEFSKLATQLSQIAPEKIDLSKVQTELKQNNLDSFYSIYNLLIMRGKIIEQNIKGPEAKWFKQWDRYREGSFYARESIDQLKLAINFYKKPMLEKAQKEAQRMQNEKNEKESRKEAMYSAAAKKYWKHLTLNDKLEADRILKEANKLNNKTRNMLDLAKLSNLKDNKSLYLFAMSCIEIEMQKNPEHDEAIQLIAESMCV